MHFWPCLHSQKCPSCSKSAAGLLLCCHQADIRMRSHRLLRLDDNKSAASCQQDWCKLIIEVFIHKLDANCFNNLWQVCKYQVDTSLIFTDLLQLDEVNRLAAICWQLATSQWRFWLCITIVGILYSQMRKLEQVCWHLVTTCYNKPISGCVRMACDSLLTTGLLQVVNRFVASWLSKRVINAQACCKLFQQVVTSLQMTSCNKPIKLSTCNKSVAFSAVY